MEEIQLTTDAARVAIAPARGGIVTRFDVGERALLFMDEATLRDPTKNVRGGVPVLFPTPGKLAGDRYAHGTLGQHGFARNLAWSVGATTRTAAVLVLESTAETLARYPWEFRFELSIALIDRTLRLEQRVVNRSATAMPYGVGFHPYFRVADAAKRDATIATGARRAFDNVTKTERDVPGTGIDLTAPEVDLHLIDHGGTSSELRHAGGTVALRGSPEFTHWVVWTLAGRDFVCVEPWTCPGNAMNTGERLIELAPGEARVTWVEIEDL